MLSLAFSFHQPKEKANDGPERRVESRDPSAGAVTTRFLRWHKPAGTSRIREPSPVSWFPATGSRQTGHRAPIANLWLAQPLVRRDLGGTEVIGAIDEG